MTKVGSNRLTVSYCCQRNDRYERSISSL